MNKPRWLYLFLSLLALALAGCASVPQPGKPMGLRLIGHATLPHKMDFQGTVVGGLSGIDYDPKTETYYLLSDDRSDFGPARFYTAKIAFDEKQVGEIKFESVVTLKQTDGSPYPNKNLGGDVPDPESIRYRAQTNTLLWTTEGDKALARSPAIREMSLDGRLLREFSRPDNFTMQPRETLRGPRDNLTFEGMTLSLDGNSVWASLESPLFEDGDPSKVGAVSGPTRITQFNIADGTTWAQFVYTADAIPLTPVPPTANADNGIVEILMAYPNRMLVLERSWSSGAGNSLRLYEVDVRNGSDTTHYPSLRNSGVRSVPKRLVADFASFGLPRLDNTEGMTFGKRLPNGKRSLVFVSDDNFSTRQITQFVVFEVDE